MDREELVRLENESIKNFLEDNKEYITGRVLDFGAGHQPYKELIESMYGVTSYTPFDNPNFPETRVINGSKYIDDLNKIRGTFQTVVCTQVVQYTLHPLKIAENIYSLLGAGGHVILTYPTCWDEDKSKDYIRYTQLGIEKIFNISGFNKIKNEARRKIYFDDFSFSLGGGYVGRIR